VLPAAHLYTRTPLILGHRGASADAPENTRTAFETALAQGVDGFELDVTLSADGVPIVIHDDTLDRTTSGAGPVNALTLAELKTLDAGYSAKFGGRFAGLRLPTLDDVFAEFGPHALINVELKHDHSAGRQLAARVVAAIHAHQLERRVIVSSFAYENLQRVRALDPALPIGALYNSATVGSWVALWRTAGLRPEAHHPGRYTLRPGSIAWYHRRGLRVNTWTVNDAATMRRLAAAGLDGLITDDPALAVKTLRRA
jgi:glycerophosphoryl diester phosphodiesterase